jgi:hypothetical protein
VVWANFGSELETVVGNHVHLVGAFISFEMNFYLLQFTPPLRFAILVLQVVSEPVTGLD